MRILHVITTLGRGGAEMQLLMMARHQVQERGHEVTVAYLKGQGELGPRFKEAGVRVAVPRGLDLRPLRVLGDLRQQIRAGKFHVVHTHLMKANFLGGVAARLGGARRIVAHKHNDESFMKAWHLALLHDLGSRLTDHATIYLSHHVKDYFLRRAVLRPRHTHVIHYGFDPGIYEPPGDDLRPRLGLTDSDFVFGTVARVVPQKGIDLLVDAFAAAVGDRADTHLVVVGSLDTDARYATRVRTQARALPCASRIHFLGPMDHPMSAFHAFDTFVLASRWEGFGLVLLEAMATGCPILATDAGAIPEVVRDGVDGRLVPAGDGPALVRALTEARLVPRPTRPRAPNQERLDHFSPRRSFEAVEAVYRGSRLEA